MKVLKFVSDAALPDIVYIEDTLQFAESHSGPITYKSISESDILAFSDTIAQIAIVIEQITDTLEFDDDHYQKLPMTIADTLEFLETLYDPFWIDDMYDTLEFDESHSQNITYSVQISDNWGFVESGHHAIDCDWDITWRTRTHRPSYGYGKAEYGSLVSYGDGDAVGLAEFKVEIYKTSTMSLLRSSTITIADTGDPDADASYTYTAAFNIADNGYYEPNLTIKVYQIDTNSNVSLAEIKEIVPRPLVP